MVGAFSVRIQGHITNIILSNSRQTCRWIVDTLIDYKLLHLQWVATISATKNPATCGRMWDVPLGRSVEYSCLLRREYSEVDPKSGLYTHIIRRYPI